MLRVVMMLATIVAMPAFAQEAEVTVTRGGFVWKDIEAAKNGAQLMVAEVRNIEAYKPLVACPIQNDTKVLVTKRLGAAASEVIVTSGPHAGCKGVLPNFQLPD